jgi:hypothetical protein
MYRQVATHGRRATAGRGTVGDRCYAGPPTLEPPAPSALPLCPQIFLSVVSSFSFTQHMPGLTRLLLETSSIHNF